MGSHIVQLVARKGDQTLACYALEPGEYLIGRDPACPIVIPAQEISRRHARLIIAPGTFEIEDVGSRYGTFLDGQQIVGRQPFTPAQKLEIGRTLVELTAAALPAAEPAESVSGASATATAVPAGPFAVTHTADRYEQGQTIKKGGMAEVLLAHDRSTQREVVLKRLLPEVASSPDNSRRFVQEALVLGQLEHPNIIPIYDLGTDPAGRTFYAMKYIRGITLKEVLDGLRKGDTRLVARYRLAQLLTIFQKVCDAIAYAHSRRAIHRDLKPANIMIGEYGEVLVMDWGLAKILSNTDPETTRPPAADNAPAGADPDATRHGTVMGTPNYMAPEQAEGRTREMDERTDLYALGAILYAMLTLRPPIVGTSEEDLMTRLKAGNIPPPTIYNNPSQAASLAGAREPVVLLHCPSRRVPEALAAVAMHALALRPMDRYQHVAELQRDVAAWQTGHATTAEQAGPVKLIQLAFRRHAARTAAAVFALLLLTAFLTHIVLREKKLSATLAALRRTAPVYFENARDLVAARRLDEALEKIHFATALEPENAEFLHLQGDIEQSLLHLSAARASYERATRLGRPQPLLAEKIALCDRLLGEIPAGQSFLPLHSMETLRVALFKQGRTAEAQVLAARIAAGQSQGHLAVQNALDRAGVKGTVTKDPRGLFRLDVSQTDLANAAAFRHLPITALNLSRTKIADLAPLATLPLQELQLTQTPATDLHPLRHLLLNALSLANTGVRDLKPLAGMPLVHLHLGGTPVTDLAPLRGLPLHTLHLNRTPIRSLAPLVGLPLVELRLDGCDQLTDLSHLVGCAQLEILILPPKARNLDLLRRLSHLRRIGYQYEIDPEKIPTAEAFWKSQSGIKK
jgi:serine/threonine protein kinase